VIFFNPAKEQNPQERVLMLRANKTKAITLDRLAQI
jgi:hypothetical protein